MVIAKPEAGSESARALLIAWLRCFGSNMLILAIPRLLMTACRFAQPVLINRTIVYVSGSATEFEENHQSVGGAELIFAAFVIYVGFAVRPTVRPSTYFPFSLKNRYSSVFITKA